MPVLRPSARAKTPKMNRVSVIDRHDEQRTEDQYQPRRSPAPLSIHLRRPSPCAAIALQQGEASPKRFGFVVEGLRIDNKRVPLCGRQFHDLAPRLNDSLSAICSSATPAPAGRGRPRGRPSSSPLAVPEANFRRPPVAVDAPREVDVARERVIQVQLVDAVIHGIGQGILLGVDLAGGRPSIAGRRSMTRGTAHELVMPGRASGRQRSNLEALHVGGRGTGRMRFETCR